MKRLAESWHEFARRDLESAKQLVSHPDLGGVAAFHCQQAIEKALKAVLALNDENVPRVHDLITLRHAARSLVQLRIDESLLREITETYVDARYPNAELGPDRVTPSPAKVQAFVEEAEKILIQVREYIDARSGA